MMVVGGIGSIAGSIAGAFVLTMIPELLRSVGDIRLVLYGAAIVAIIIFAPQGTGRRHRVARITCCAADIRRRRRRNNHGITGNERSGHYL